MIIRNIETGTLYHLLALSREKGMKARNLETGQIMQGYFTDMEYFRKEDMPLEKAVMLSRERWQP